MGATISVVALVLVFASGSSAPKPPVSSLTVPQAATATALPDKDSLLETIPWRRSPQAFATWGGPWGSRPVAGLYDERYVTW